MSNILKSKILESIRNLDEQIFKIDRPPSEINREKLTFDVQWLLLKERRDAYETILNLMEQL